MRTFSISYAGALAIALATLMASTGAIAEKPDWAGGGKSGQSKQKEKYKEKYEKDDDSRDTHERRDRHFKDDHRIVIQNYYSDEYRKGRCPPGLAKKNNGCMPPGQARKWSVGKALPKDVIYYDLPPSISVRIGVPPSGYRYVRVASDILMIAVGTSMVVDAIENLSR